MPKPASSPTHVLFLALSGIGNLLMQLPTIEAVKRAHPEWRVTVWVAPRGTKPIASSRTFIDAVIEGKIKRSVIGHIRFVLRLTREKPDIAIMLSPGQLIKGATYMFLSGANQRLAHRYPHLGNPESAFLLTDSVPEEPATHDIEQNLRLLTPLGINTDSVKGQPYHFSVPTHNSQEGATLLRTWHLPADKKLVGLHAGSAPNFLWKRWPLDRFATVARALIANHHAHILLFGGPEEKKQNKQLQKMIGTHHTTIVTTSLLTTAALMKQCHLFLANDSGLMHLAAAVGVPTVGIFGPTDETTTGPRGVKSHVIRAPHTKPVYSTEQNFDLGAEPHETLLRVTPEMVHAVVAKYLSTT